MQGLLSSLSTAPPQPLSSANLGHHTALHPPVPRRTVQAYLDTTVATGGAYDDPPLSPTRVVAEFAGVSTPPRFRAWRDAQALEHAETSAPKRRREEEALVLHHPDPGAPATGDGNARPTKKKPLLVQAMRGRVSSTVGPAGEAALTERKRPGGKDGKRAGSAASSILVPRAERVNGADRVTAPKDAKGKGKAKEPKGGKLRAEAEAEDELDEVEERLRARRERRRAKALIRKDRTLTAAAVGVAAASKVKAARRRLLDDDDNEQENEDAGRKKKRRSTKEGESRRIVQDMGRARNVASGRLTLKPKPQVGIFNKGKASARTRVGKGLPDLAFSEHAFLHGPDPSSSSSASSASSSSSSSLQPLLIDENRPPGPPRATHAAAHIRNRKRTYGSKPAQRTSLSRRPGTGTGTGDWPAAAVTASEHRTSVFSHVEVPRRTTRWPLRELRADAEGTESDAFSAASLARRARARGPEREREQAPRAEQREDRDEVDTEEMGTEELECVLRDVASVRDGALEEEDVRGADDAGALGGAGTEQESTAYGGGADDWYHDDGAVEAAAIDVRVDTPLAAHDDGAASIATPLLDFSFIDASVAYANPPGADAPAHHTAGYPAVEPYAYDTREVELSCPSPSVSTASFTALSSPAFDAPHRFSTPAVPQRTLDDDGAFREAMRRQWPRTRL